MEVKTSPVRAIYYNDRDQMLNDNVPGSIFVSNFDDDGEAFMWYFCPCGCGSRGILCVGENKKPTASPSWQWNGSKDTPTLHPSVHHVGHWHGWLKDGVWTSV